jgi:TctA family transporter
MELFDSLGLGLSVALTPSNLLFCLIGTLLGTLIGVLPGVGPIATVAMLLPITFYMPPVGALIMLAGIYYGSQYGGSTTAILINMPGESSSVVTCLDGHAMARRGRAGAALAIAALGSFFAGTIATVLVVCFSPWLAAMAAQFGAVEYFAMMVFGLVATLLLARGSILKALGMLVIGLMLGLIGTDINSGAQRFTFGISELADGIGFVPVSIGLFGIAEIIANLENPERRSAISRIGTLWPTRQEARRAGPAVLRGTALGSLLGVLPGGGTLLSAFAAYMIEKRISKNPAEFGHGAVEGLAAPESANNAAAQTSFIPLLTLGIPANAVMALMVGAMMIHGIVPGPQIMQSQPDLFWGMIVSMWAGNLMLVIINLPLIGIWVRLLSVPYHLLYPAILIFSLIGVYSLNNSPFEVLLTVAFGIAGYVFSKLRCEPAPLLLGLVLGPMLEENLRRSLLMSRGNSLVFLEHPISLGLLVSSVILLALTILPAVRQTRDVAFEEA